MISVALNWRRNVIFSLFILLLVSSFHSQTRHLSAAWWVEQQRYSGLSYQITRREMSLPSWYAQFQIIIQRLNAINLIHCLSKLSSVVCFHILQKVILKMPNNGIQPLEFTLSWSGDVEQTRVEINFQVVVDRIEPPIEFALPAFQNDTDVIETEFKIVGYEDVKNIVMYSPEKEISIAADTPAELAVQLNLSTGEPDEVLPETKLKYSADTEREMKKFYNTLSEKDKRRYAGIETMKLGHGGRKYIAELFGCSRKTVSKGVVELIRLPEDSVYEKRIRKPGGGRKPYWLKHDERLDIAFFDVVKSNTAGDPMNDSILWTNLSHLSISELLYGKHKISVSTTIVRQLLSDYNFHRRKAQKKQTKKTVANRNAQFENITMLQTEYKLTGDPVISMDSKKKEFLGLYRNGHLYTKQTIITPDHDFPSYAKGRFTPHSVWDVNKNKGYINIGISRDTSKFACDSLKKWWYNQGQVDYPHAKRLLILCDGGGSNSSNSYLFKKDIQQVADETRLEIRIAHYPPYTSKYNPIEHRMFPHVTKACRGVIFEDFEQVKSFMEKTKTRKGLTVKAEIITKEYEAKRKVDDEFKKNMKIVFDEHLPKWNYRAIPIANC